MTGYEEIKSILNSPKTHCVQRAMDFMERRDLWKPEDVHFYLLECGYNPLLISDVLGDLITDPFFIARHRGWSDGYMTIHPAVTRTFTKK
jgi:hypothetical protein